MSFVDHLEELRWHLIRSVIAIGIFTIAAFACMPYIFHHIILAPSRTDFWTYQMLCKLSPSLCIDKIDFTLQSRNMSGQFTMHILASIVAGLVVAFPYVFWEIWKFIKPALHTSEKKYTAGTVLAVTTLFFLGVLFGYFIIAPLSINFLANYKLDESIVNQFDITSYMSTLLSLIHI